MKNFGNILTGAAVVAALAVAGAAHAATNPPFSAPGVSSPGYPDFISGNYEATLTSSMETVGKTKETVFTLSISGSDPNLGVFNFPGADYLAGNETISLTANFTSTGQLITGLSNTFKVTGSLPASSNPTYGTAPAGFSWSAQPNETLFSATLTGYGVDSTHEGLGFVATDFGGWADQKQFTNGSTTESLWLFELSSLLPASSGTSQIQSLTNNAGWNAFLAELKSGSALKAADFYLLGGIATVPLPAAFWLLLSGIAAVGVIGRRRSRLLLTGADA
jgi:hypothetical protein